MEYANASFGGTVPGWRTDRGHFYIVFGAPDRIVSRLGASVPYEDWVYGYLDALGTDVVFEFADRDRTGQLVSTMSDDEKQALFEAAEPLEVMMQYGEWIRLPCEGPH